MNVEQLITRLLQYKFVPPSYRNRMESLFDPVNGTKTIGNSAEFWVVAFAMTGLAALYPFLTNAFRVISMSVIFVFVFLALSLTVIWGYTGIFSFGQTAFFGLGGYTYGTIAINTVELWGGTNIAILVGIIVPMILAAAVGYFMFYGRLIGVYVAIITLAVTLILQLLFARTAGQQFTIGEAHLGGYNGMTNIPSLVIGVEPFTIELGTTGMYYFILLLLISIYLGIRYLVNSNFGSVMIAIREDEQRTEMLGYDVRKIKLQVFIFAGAIGGLGGVLLASVQNFISPPLMGLVAAAMPIIWTTVGGRTTILGALVGAIGLQYLNNELAALGSQYAIIVLGLILILAIMFFPSGIIVWLDEKRQQETVLETSET